MRGIWTSGRRCPPQDGWYVAFYGVLAISLVPQGGHFNTPVYGSPEHPM